MVPEPAASVEGDQISRAMVLSSPQTQKGDLKTP